LPEISDKPRAPRGVNGRTVFDRKGTGQPIAATGTSFESGWYYRRIPPGKPVPFHERPEGRPMADKLGTPTAREESNLYRSRTGSYAFGGEPREVSELLKPRRYHKNDQA
jgi:hypothetical protein